MYSKDFYEDLYRVLRKNGLLFHYTGTPYSKRKGNSFQDNTMKRLVSVGFTKQQAKPETLGLSVIKR